MIYEYILTIRTNCPPPPEAVDHKLKAAMEAEISRELSEDDVLVKGAQSIKEPLHVRCHLEVRTLPGDSAPSWA